MNALTVSTVSPSERLREARSAFVPPPGATTAVADEADLRFPKNFGRFSS